MEHSEASADEALLLVNGERIIIADHPREYIFRKNEAQILIEYRNEILWAKPITWQFNNEEFSSAMQQAKEFVKLHWNTIGRLEAPPIPPKIPPKTSQWHEYKK